MKFYYNGKLMRTSKTHEYKYAIITENGCCCSCHGTLESAQKEFRRPIAECEKSIANFNMIIRAINSGKKYIDIKEYRYTHRVHFSGKDIAGDDRSQVSTWEKYIRQTKNSMADYESRKIVELEQR